MKLLDRYVFCEWLKVFLVTMGVTLGILVMHDMYSNLGDLIECGATFREICLFYGLLTPSFIPVVLPVSLLLSIVFTVGAMHRNNEITAMRSAGLNVFQITKSLWLAGALLTVGLFWLNADAVPSSIEDSRLMMERLEIESELKGANSPQSVGAVQSLSFDNKKERRLWIMNSFSVATNKASGIFVSTMDEKGRDMQKIMAREAVYDDVENCWFFVDGQELFYDAETRRPVRSVAFDKKYFNDFKEDPKIMRLSMKRAKDLSLFELGALIDAASYRDAENTYDSNRLRAYKVRYASLWLSPLICVLVVAMAIPFSVAGVRTNPMVGVSKTMAMFFGYYIIENISNALGANGILSPFAAALAPAIIVAVFAARLYRKVV